MTSNSGPEVEIARIKYAFWLAIIGLLLAAVVAVFLVSQAEMQNVQSSDIAAIVGLFTSVLGTLVGAFFGLQIGAAGTEHERRSRQNAEADKRRADTIAQMAMGHLSADDKKPMIEMMKQMQ